MKKKLITVLLLSMIICVVGCDNAEETVEPTVEAVVETSLEEIVVENVVEETTEAMTVVMESETVEETAEEVVEDPTLSEANATAQILKLLEIYNNILKGNDNIAKMMQDNIETENGKWDTEVAVFKNGETASTTSTIASIGIAYYRNCLEGGTPWNNIIDWMSRQESDEVVLLMNFENSDSVENTTSIRLWDAIYLCPYLANQSSIELVNRTETDEYIFVKGEVSAYTYDLVLSGIEDTGFKAVYDSEDNLLTIDMPDDFVLPEEFYSFEQ